MYTYMIHCHPCIYNVMFYGMRVSDMMNYRLRDMNDPNWYRSDLNSTNMNATDMSESAADDYVMKRCV